MITVAFAKFCLSVNTVTVYSPFETNTLSASIGINENSPSDENVFLLSGFSPLGPLITDVNNIFSASLIVPEIVNLSSMLNVSGSIVAKSTSA